MDMPEKCKYQVFNQITQNNLSTMYYLGLSEQNNTYGKLQFTIFFKSLKGKTMALNSYIKKKCLTTTFR